MITVTRLVEFDAGHRLLNHESKCAHCHGHRYKAEITCTGPSLDKAGRVIDFGVIKQLIGGWVDDEWDHAFIVNVKDTRMRQFLELNEQKHFVLDTEPSAEHMAQFLLLQANSLLTAIGSDVEVVQVKLWETPNCYAIATAECPKAAWI